MISSLRKRIAAQKQRARAKALAEKKMEAERVRKRLEKTRRAILKEIATATKNGEESFTYTTRWSEDKKVTALCKNIAKSLNCALSHFDHHDLHQSYEFNFEKPFSKLRSEYILVLSGADLAAGEVPRTRY